MPSITQPGGAIDNHSVFSLAVFGLAAYLTWGLHLEFMQPILPKLASLFGLLQPVPGPFAYELESMAGGVWCLGSFFICLPAVMGAEDSATREVRHLYSLGVWGGFLLANFKYWSVQEGGLKSSYFLFWLGNDLIMTLFHLKWVLSSKLFRDMTKQKGA